jgi:hypothetical protein
LEYENRYARISEGRPRRQQHSSSFPFSSHQAASVNLFVLTPEEKRVIAFVMLMILVGVGVKEYRKRHPVPPVPIEAQKHPWMRKLPPLPSPTTDTSQADSAAPDLKRSRKARKKLPSVPPSEAEEDDGTTTESQPPP